MNKKTIISIIIECIVLTIVFIFDRNDKIEILPMIGILETIIIITLKSNKFYNIQAISEENLTINELPYIEVSDALINEDEIIVQLGENHTINTKIAKVLSSYFILVGPKGS